jgi:hypothetical protein
VTPRTPTLPPTEPTMWRKLLARTHPDTGGSHDLFIWTGALRGVVCNSSLHDVVSPEASDHASRRREGSTWRPTQTDKPRIPYPTGADFEEVTRIALRLADDNNVYGEVLSLLVDCYPLEHLGYEQERGASYKRLAAIAHAWGMSKEERIGWYRVAEGIPLSDRHAGHILSRIKRQAA